MAAEDDDLILGTMVCNAEDGQLALVAYWAEYRRKHGRDVVVMVADVLSCYDCADN